MKRNNNLFDETKQNSLENANYTIAGDSATTITHCETVYQQWANLTTTNEFKISRINEIIIVK